MGIFWSVIPATNDDPCPNMSRDMSAIHRRYPLINNVTGEIRPAKIGFTWKLKNFEKTFIERPLYGCFASPSFFMSDDSHQWYWHFILECNSRTGYIAVFVELLPHKSAPEMSRNNPCGNFWLRSTIFRVGFNLSGIDRKGRKVNISRTEQMESPHQNYSWCCHDFIDKDIFVNPNKMFTPENLRIKNVTLSIFCEGFGAGGRALPSRHELWQPAIYGALSRAFVDFSSLYRDRRMSDFKIRIDNGDEISVHKLILAARSPVFAAMFEHDMTETRNNVLVMEGTRRVVLDKLLQYIYCGIVKDIDEVNLELMVLAHRYEMTDLKEICEISMLDSLNVDIAPELLAIADMYSLAILKQKAIVFINRNAKKVMRTTAYLNMTVSYPDLFVELFENQIDHPVEKDIPDKVLGLEIEYSAAEEAFFTYKDVRKHFAAFDRKLDQ